MAADDVPVLQSDPLTDDIFPLVTAGRKLQIVYQCLKLGIFDEIDSLEQSETAEVIASKFNYNPHITERLLNSLVCFNLLHKECGVYSLPESSQKYLVSTKSTSMVPQLTTEFEFMFPLFNCLPIILKQDGDKGSNSGTRSKGNNSRADNSTRKATPSDYVSVLESNLTPIASAVTQSYDFSQYQTLVELGDRSGVVAYEFIKVYEKMNAIVLNQQESVEFPLKQQREQTKSRVEFMSGDIFTDGKLPSCDVIILSHIVHKYCEEKIDFILEKVFNSLNSGGCVLLLEKCLHDDKTGPYDAVLMDAMLMVACEGRERTLLEYQNLLQRHDFINVMWREIQGRNGQDVISAFKP